MHNRCRSEGAGMRAWQAALLTCRMLLDGPASRGDTVRCMEAAEGARKLGGGGSSPKLPLDMPLAPDRRLSPPRGWESGSTAAIAGSAAAAAAAGSAATGAAGCWLRNQLKRSGGGCGGAEGSSSPNMVDPNSFCDADSDPGCPAGVANGVAACWLKRRNASPSGEAAGGGGSPGGNGCSTGRYVVCSSAV